RIAVDPERGDERHWEVPSVVVGGTLPGRASGRVSVRHTN
ncbi:MAG: hypothetical protein QOE06_3345, partial [Thermoleophilaceae bacterium]|nr:hypothetical protein [Thermoleophilaceae bacterium]